MVCVKLLCVTTSSFFLAVFLALSSGYEVVLILFFWYKSPVLVQLNVQCITDYGSVNWAPLLSQYSLSCILDVLGFAGRFGLGFLGFF